MKHHHHLSLREPPIRAGLFVRQLWRYAGSAASRQVWIPTIILVLCLPAIRTVADEERPPQENASDLRVRMTHLEKAEDLRTLDGVGSAKPTQHLITDYLAMNGVNIAAPGYVKFNPETKGMLLRAAAEDLDKADALLARFREPALKLDDAHNASECKYATERYCISPAAGAVLDAGGYNFKKRPLDESEWSPAKVLLLGQRGRQELRYEIPWVKGQTQYSLNAETLIPPKSSDSFEGFKAGEQWLLLVMGPAGAERKNVVIWSSVIQVR